MSEPSASRSHDDDVRVESAEIQFDQAEYATSPPSGPTCGVCQRAIMDEYHELGAKVFCSACRHGVEAALRGGSRVARVLKALIFGSAAAAAGAVIYYVILRATGYNIGLVAVLVGFMVGGAVRKGTGNRGGLFYQFLAVFLAYTAIGAMHVPFMFDEPDRIDPKVQHANPVLKEADKSPAKAKVFPRAPRNGVKDPARPLPDIPPNPFASARPEGARETQGPVAVAKNEEPAVEPGGRTMMLPLFALVLVFVLYASPVLHAIQAPISGLIFGFALWEAWKINKGVQLTFTGPFRVSMNEVNRLASEVEDGA